MVSYREQTAGQDWNLVAGENGTLQFQVRDGDHPVIDGEIAAYREQSLVVFDERFANDSALRLGFDLTIDPGSPNTAPYLALARLLANMPGGESVLPVFSINLIGDMMVAYVRSADADGTVTFDKVFSDVVDIERGRTYHIDVLALFDPDGSGRLVLMRDGSIVADYAGPLGHAGQESVSWSEGILRGAAATETLTASFASLVVDVGASVEFPEVTEFLPEPTLVLKNVAFADAASDQFLARLTGEAVPGATVDIFVNQTLYGSVTAQADGSYAVDVLLADRGSYRISAVAFDASGASSIASYAVDFTIGNANDPMEAVAPIFILTVGRETFLPQSAEQPWSIQAIDDDSLRFELRDNDRHDWDSEHWHRVERSEIAASQHPIADGVPVAVSYGFLIEPGAPNTAWWMVLGQFHQDLSTEGDAVSPPFEISFVGERMAIVVNFGSVDARQSKTLFLDTSDIVRGHLYEMKITAVFDADGGRLVVERDGVMLADYSGPLGYEEQQGVYWAEGIYRADNATETIAVQYHDLLIETGDAVEFPAEGSFIPAPRLTVESASFDAGGTTLSELVESGASLLMVSLSGFAKPGTVVTIYDRGIALLNAATDADGRFSVEIGLSASSHHDLVAVATDADGREGLASAPATVVVATSAEIVAMLGGFPADNAIASIVLTDGNVLHLSSRQEVTTALLRDADTLAKIEGGYTLLWSEAITGKSYDRQDTSYLSNGFVTEITRWSGTRLLYEDAFQSDGSHVLTTWSPSGAYEESTFSAAGRVANKSFDAAGSLLTQRDYFADGSFVTHYFNPSTHREVHYVTVYADKTKTDTYVDILGRDYRTQVLSYDSAGRLIAQDRIAESGIRVQASVWNADGSKSVSTFDPATGRERVSDVTASDGSRILTRFGDALAAYVMQEDHLATSGAMTSRHTVFADGTSSLLTLAIQGEAYTSLLERFDGAGVFLSSVGYLGSVVVYSKISHADGSRETHVYDAATGAETSAVYWGADGGHVNDQFQIVGRTYTSQSQSFDSASQLIEGSRWLGDTLVQHEVRGQDGTRTVETWIDGVHTVTRFAAQGPMVSSERFDGDGTLIQAEHRPADGSHVTDVFDGVTGALMRHTIVEADGSRVDTIHSISGKAYDTQIMHYDLSGKLTDMVRFAGGQDGLIVQEGHYRSDGSSVTSAFDSMGREMSRIVVDDDGARQIVTTLYDGSDLTPSFIREDHRSSSGERLWSDVVHADGVHQITAFSKGLVLSGHTGVSDQFKSAGGETFVFGLGAGRDSIRNFQTDAGPDHDLIVIDDGIATTFDDLHISAVGRDVVIALTADDSITLLNSDIAHLAADDFLFR